MTNFQKSVYDVVSRIPRGKTMTYGEVAIAIGNPKSYRAVGNALNKNPFIYTERSRSTPKVPCRRVIKSDGSVGGFAFGSDKKISLLKKEKAI